MGPAGITCKLGTVGEAMIASSHEASDRAKAPLNPKSELIPIAR